jgi:hypothetical protein
LYERPERTKRIATGDKEALTTLPQNQRDALGRKVSGLWPKPRPGIFAQTEADWQTDRQTDEVSEADRWLDRLEVDRTKTALIELMVYSGWQVGEIRAVIKGDNGAIGAEVAAARERLGLGEDPPRMLQVRDAAGERLIPM